MRRLHANAHVMWVTNGDGLAPFEKADPLVYASKREAESRAAMRIVGYKDSQLDFLGHSEIAIYDDLKAISLVPAKEPLPKHCASGCWLGLRTSKSELLLGCRGDVVWTEAFQGGHVEHDLSHYLTWKAVQAQRKAGRTLPFYELPEYELMFFVPLRFPPWKRGEGHVIELTDEELA